MRVLDLSRLFPGPAATWHLRGLGATVDRVESPGTGDPTRHTPPFVDGTGAYFAAFAAGARSVVLDLRRPEAIDALLSMLPSYDVLVEGFRPGVLEAAGLAPERLHAVNARLVIARLSGWGQTGPWRDRPGHDLNYTALSGALSFASLSDGAPPPLPVQIADFGGALVAAMGVCAALVERERTGRGRVLDVSLAESALALLAPHVLAATAEGRDPVPGGEVLTGGVPVYGTYVCSDGKWLTVGALEPKFREALAAGVGPDLGRDDLAAALKTRPRDEWVEALAAACVAPVLTPGELADHPQLRERGAVERLGGVTWVRPPLGGAAGAVPALGAHTDVVLREAGLSDDAIAALRAARAAA